jgi:ABC-2 type transport system permease protein
MRHALAVAHKELRQIARDRRTLLLLLFVPIFFLLLYGYALSWDIRHIRLAVVDHDRSVESRAIVSAFVNSGYFDLVGDIGENEIDGLMDRGDVRAVLVIPDDLARDAASRTPSAIQVLLNGDNANTATTVMGYASTILHSESMAMAAAAAGRPLAPLVSVEPRIWYNPELHSALFLVPGLIAYIAMLSSVISTAVSIVKEKERGTMEQIRMAPIGPLPYVVGKSLPYFVISLLSSMGIILAAMALFGLPMRGSWLLLILTMALFLFGALGLGLLVSSVSDSQQVAFEVAVLVSFLPSLILSGFIFPISSMPAFLQIITYLFSPRYFLVALRGVLLKGVGAAVLWPQLAALLAYALVVLLVASLRLQREWARG